jgi:hypothetical protein
MASANPTAMAPGPITPQRITSFSLLVPLDGSGSNRFALGGRPLLW